MPDPQRNTISASQVGALFGASPYQTPFTLWHELNGTAPDISDDDEDERMYWGKTLEPAILAHVERHLDLIVLPNAAQTYQRHETEPVGATVDAITMDPNRGPGVIEAKTSDWMMFKDRWTKTQAPPYVELQVQTQLGVRGATWGHIGCLVGGNEFHHYPREIQPDVWAEIVERASAFLSLIHI